MTFGGPCNQATINLKGNGLKCILCLIPPPELKGNAGTQSLLRDHAFMFHISGNLGQLVHMDISLCYWAICVVFSTGDINQCDKISKNS